MKNRGIKEQNIREKLEESPEEEEVIRRGVWATFYTSVQLCLILVRYQAVQVIHHSY